MVDARPPSNDQDRSPEKPSESPSARLRIVSVAPRDDSILHLDQLPPIDDAHREDPYLGATIDKRYRLEAILGEGGMGVVYRASHSIIGRKVAVKVLRADMARDEEATERFLNEARSASAIGNPHIIDITDFGRFPDGSTYFVMEYLDGESLSDVVADGLPTPVDRLIHIAHQLAEGLHAAHEAGIVHRDLKPENIFLVTRGNIKDFVKILDFGIAKVSSQVNRITRAGAVFGTPHYMSPEQAAGAPVDQRGDIYSFGVILYELASGKVPFDADNFMGILTQHMYKAPIPLRALVSDPQLIPPGLEAIVLKCLSKRPEQRYQSMVELLEDLIKLEEGFLPGAVPELMTRSGDFNVPADYFKQASYSIPPPPSMPSPAPAQRLWLIYALLAGLAAVLIVVVAAIAVLLSRDPPMPAVAEAPTDRQDNPADSTPKVQSAKAITHVSVAIEPSFAEIFEGDQLRGTSPMSVEVAAGQRVTLMARASGYVSRSFIVDGTTSGLTVKLDKEKASANSGAGHPVTGPRPRPGSKSKPEPTSGGFVVDPWRDH